MKSATITIEDDGETGKIEFGFAPATSFDSSSIVEDCFDAICTMLESKKLAYTTDDDSRINPDNAISKYIIKFSRPFVKTVIV